MRNLQFTPFLLVASALFLITACSAEAQEKLSLTRGIPPGGAYESTYQIKYGDSMATGFTIEVDNRQYIVTARHVIEGFKSGDQLHVRVDQRWFAFTAKPIFLENKKIDIAALALAKAYFPRSQIHSSARIYLAQEAYFLGFPYGLSSDFELNRNTNADDLPATIPTTYPFIKRSIVSSLGGENQVFYLDGHNNPGFSGGPVIVGDLSKKEGEEEIGVAGVVSAYKSQLLQVIDSISTEDVSTQQRKEIVTRYVAENAGIVVAFRMKPIIAKIRQQPIGPLMPSH